MEIKANKIFFEGTQIVDMLNEKPLFDSTLEIEQKLEEENKKAFIRACAKWDIDPDVVEKQAILIKNFKTLWIVKCAIHSDLPAFH